MHSPEFNGTFLGYVVYVCSCICYILLYHYTPFTVVAAVDAGPTETADISRVH